VLRGAAIFTWEPGPQPGVDTAEASVERSRPVSSKKRGSMPAGLLAFLIALFASLMLTVPVRALALRVGMVDLPGPRKVHLSPIPLLGGVAMYAAVVLSVLFTFTGAARAQIVGILTGATVVAVVGILDDRGMLHHQVKLFIGMPLAACVLLVTGIHAQVFEVFFSGRAAYILDAVLTVIFVVGITASFSILDHMDGLCAGVAATASIFFALLAYLNGQTLVTTLAAAVLGAAAGFLRWNFKPAKIFMGDGGAMFLGFLMATLALKLRLEQANYISAWLAPLLILGVTIFDTTLVTISRSRRGLLPFATPGKDHAAHRLANLGLGHRGAVLLMYLLGLISGGAAILVSYLAPLRAVLVAVLASAVVLIGVVFLERAPYERQVKKPAAIS
jgi:UDP-GlcNAc:undecaprenyl-phosphate/decaprenyl-phosphate GlcNAc-1-phosphate transferase